MPSPPGPPEAALRVGVAWPQQLVLAGLLAACAVALVHCTDGLSAWAVYRFEALVALGGFAAWRWSWLAVHVIRATIYRYLVFPRLRRRALAAEASQGPVPEVCVLVTTYREKPWITARVFGSILRELDTLDQTARRMVVAVTGADEDDREILRTYENYREVRDDKTAGNRPELVVLRNDRSKRDAIADGLCRIARAAPRDDAVVLLMDGDTEMQHGLLRKVLPVMRLDPEVAAVTTNEKALVSGPAWYAEWLSLRFGQRHLYMCSLALSERLLCLTGRLSAFRASVALDPRFRDLIRDDWSDHWLWGRFKMLSGDDKSTWYWVAAQGGRMLYVPDAVATTIDTVEGSAVARAIANMQRWSGNMLRNSSRAVALGPGRLRPFPWWCTVDQRLSIWTTLVGPALLILSLCLGLPALAAGYALWVLVSRTVRALVAWIHGRRVSAWYIPLQVLTEWGGALLKAWICFHPAQQAWRNRGNRALDSTQGRTFRLCRMSLAHYLALSSMAAIPFAAGAYLGIVPVFREAPLFTAAAGGAVKGDHLLTATEPRAREHESGGQRQ